MSARRRRKGESAPLLKPYEYTAPATSLFYRWVIKPTCERVAEACYTPAISADAITRAACACALGAYAAAALGQWALAGLLWALYGWGDNLDGAWARRGRTQSARGELLDHGCDAFAVTASSLLLLELSLQSARTHTPLATWAWPGADHWHAPPTRAHTALLLFMFVCGHAPVLVSVWGYRKFGRLLLGGSLQGRGLAPTVDEFNLFFVPLVCWVHALLPSFWGTPLGMVLGWGAQRKGPLATPLSTCMLLFMALVSTLTLIKIARHIRSHVRARQLLAPALLYTVAGALRPPALLLLFPFGQHLTRLHFFRTVGKHRGNSSANRAMSEASTGAPSDADTPVTPPRVLSDTEAMAHAAVPNALFLATALLYYAGMPANMTTAINIALQSIASIVILNYYLNRADL